MAKVQFAAIIKDWENSEIEEPDPKGAKDAQGRLIGTRKVSLGMLSRAALNFVPQGQGEQAPDYEEIIRRGTLCGEIAAAERDIRLLEIDEKDVVLIREMLIKIGYTPWIVLQVAKLLKGVEVQAA